MYHNDNLHLSKEMIKGLKAIRKLRESGSLLCIDDVDIPLTQLYSENLVEPKTIEVDGKKVMSCVITEFGENILKQIDEEDEKS